MRYLWNISTRSEETERNCEGLIANANALSGLLTMGKPEGLWAIELLPCISPRVPALDLHRGRDYYTGMTMKTSDLDRPTFTVL